MIPSTSLMPRRHRSTRAEILARDTEVRHLVDELKKAQQRNWTILADCIERCHSASVDRAEWRSSSEASSRPGDRYRCKTLACPTCGTGMWRKAVTNVLHHFHDIDVVDLSLVTIAGSSATEMEAVRVEVRKMRRSLRDLRDAMAEKRTSWRAVEIAGLVDLMPVREHGPFLVQPVVRFLVHHPGVPRSSIERVLRDWCVGSCRQFRVEMYREDAFLSLAPGTGLPMAWRALVVATMFEWHRGTEPLRVAVGSKGCFRSGPNPAAQRSPDERAATFREPMPIAF